MTAHDDTPDRVAEIVRSILRVEESDTARLTRALQPQWDSLAQIEIIFSVEEEFGISFDADGLAELDSVERLTREVLART